MGTWLPGVAQHVTQRGNRRQEVFFTDDVRRVYLSACLNGPQRFDRNGLVKFVYASELRPDSNAQSTSMNRESAVERRNALLRHTREYVETDHFSFVPCKEGEDSFTAKTRRKRNSILGFASRSSRLRGKVVLHCVRISTRKLQYDQVIRSLSLNFRP